MARARRACVSAGKLSIMVISTARTSLTQYPCRGPTCQNGTAASVVHNLPEQRASLHFNEGLPYPVTATQTRVS
ncbi:hypothetical protein B0H21DRAFT_727341 [Amylocystis lapponica]|nr:hypothetical protein B0H21DRAFT_727341 [Amylocystis lapponica]